MTQTPEAQGPENFVLLGVARDPNGPIERQLTSLPGVSLRAIDWGAGGRLFLHVSGGEVAETANEVALKVGFVRAPDWSPRTAQQLLAHGLVSSEQIKSETLTGSALVACFDKVQPRFVAYKTLFSLSCLYYMPLEGGFLASDRLALLAELAGRPAMDKDAVVQHFCFGTTIGARSYYQGIYRLRQGEMLTWKDGNWHVRLIKDLKALRPERTMRGSRTLLPTVYKAFQEHYGAYVADIRASGADLGNLLSGGIDSSFTQLLLNEQLNGARPKSYSYVMHAPSFAPEVEYARHAQEVFGTEHTFIDIQPQDFPALLVRGTKMLARPVYSAMEPCKLAVAEAMARQPGSPQYYWISLCTDAFFGWPQVCEIGRILWLRNVPGAPWMLETASRALGDRKVGKRLHKAAQFVANPHSAMAPINTVAVGADFRYALKCFGEAAVLQALEARREDALQYLNTDDYVENVHTVALFGPVEEVAYQAARMFRNCGKELVFPFYDEGVAAIAFMVKAQDRYVRGRRCKYILKDLLAQKSSSKAPYMRKLGSSFNPEVRSWMRSGLLRGMWDSIDRPSFLSQTDLDNLLHDRGLFRWRLFTWDTWKKAVYQS